MHEAHLFESQILLGRVFPLVAGIHAKTIACGPLQAFPLRGGKRAHGLDALAMAARAALRSARHSSPKI